MYPEHALLRALAIEAARAGGQAALPWFRRAGLAVETKSDASPVTVADRSSEGAVQAIIRAARPDDGWIGEETGEQPGTSRYRWIVDPIDGTRNFIRGIPLWSVLVACEEDTPDGPRVVAACAGFPALDEWYDACLGGGARGNGQPIRVSSTQRIEDGLFAYYTFELLRSNGLEQVFRTLSGRSAAQRGGGDAYMHMLIASGRAEFSVEPGVKVWDVAATSLILEEAGGRWCDLTGGRDLRAGGVVMSNGHTHAAVLDVLAADRHA